MKITDFERIATVEVSSAGRFDCPKCEGVCKPSLMTVTYTSFREFDCLKCGRGWSEVPDKCHSVADAIIELSEDREAVRKGERTAHE